MSALPGPLSIGSAFPFVGRERELTALRSLVPWAQGEGRRVVLVGGDAGSGKSRLVREFAASRASFFPKLLFTAPTLGKTQH